MMTVPAISLTSDLSSDFWALEPKYCVNPFDIISAGSALQMNSVHLHSSPAAKLADQCDKPTPNIGTKRPDICPANQNLTTDLENFQDLTQWCRRTPKTENMSMSAENDELNTPVIEFGEFLFSSAENIENSVKDDILSVYPINDTDLYKSQMNIPISRDEVVGSGLLPSECIVKTEDLKMNNNYQYSNIDISFDGDGVYRQEPEPEAGGAGCGPGELGAARPASADVTIVFDSASSSVKQESLGGGAAPASAARGAGTGELRLDFSNLWMDGKQPVLDTPEVINTALSLDRGFNLISFINEEEVSAEGGPAASASSASSASRPAEDAEHSQCTYASCDLTNSSDTSDEDYEPPWKQRRASDARPRKGGARKSRPAPRAASIASKRDSCDSELSNVSVCESARPVRRGRPPKRNVSISSESNADNEGSRYRELRDKNNEASRRSRLNRKLKDLQIEQEAKDLDLKNRKLKVRVSELEKLVNSMRNNLMQMLIKSK